MRLRHYFGAGAFATVMISGVLFSGILSSAAPVVPAAGPPPPLQCIYTPPERLTAAAPPSATARAAAGSSQAACLQLDPYVPQPAKYVYGAKPNALAADGSVAMYCPDQVHGGWLTLAASTKFCPQAPVPKRVTSYIPGAPDNGADGVVLCDNPTTKQIEIICTTGKDPGPGVNTTAP